MKQSRNTSVFFKALASGVLISGIASQMVSAAVIFDLRATGKNALPLSGGDTAKAISALAGDQIELTLFVQVTGVAAGAEGYQSALGKTIATHTGGGGGNQSAPVLLGNFTGGSVGTVQDLNADGFADIGSPLATTSSTAGNMFPRFTTNGAFDLTGTPITDGKEFALFKLTYTVVNPGGAASIQFTQQLTTVINSSTAQVDGNSVLSKNLGLPAGANASSLAAPVVITAVPEPSAFGMVLIGALGLVGFRRLGFRRSA